MLRAELRQHLVGRPVPHADYEVIPARDDHVRRLADARYLHSRATSADKDTQERTIVFLPFEMMHHATTDFHIVQRRYLQVNE